MWVFTNTPRRNSCCYGEAGEKASWKPFPGMRPSQAPDHPGGPSLTPPLLRNAESRPAQASPPEPSILPSPRRSGSLLSLPGPGAQVQKGQQVQRMPCPRPKRPWGGGCCTLTVACQAPLPVGFSRQEYWSELSFRIPGDIPNPGIEPTSLVFPALTGGFFSTVPPRKPLA